MCSLTTECVLLLQVTEWLGDEAEIRKMSAAASAVGVTHAKATKEIAREIAELVL